MITNWSLNNRMIETHNASSDSDLSEAVFQSIQSRGTFSFDDEKVYIPRYFYRFVGVDGDEDEYYNYLYNLDKSLSSLDKLYLPIKGGFEGNIPNDEMSRLNLLWSTLISMEEINGTIILNLLDTDHLLLKFPSEPFNSQIRSNLQGLIEYYFEVHNNEIEPVKFKQFLFYIVTWINRYVGDLFINFDYVKMNPKVLYYGDISPEETYFLIYLSSMGCDILYFHTMDDFLFQEIDRVGFSAQVEFNRKLPLKEFPKKVAATRANTIAYQAREGIREVLSSNQSGFFNPWQLIDHKSSAVTLKTTYDEIFIIGRERAMLRPEWKVDGDTVFTPNIFAKVSGTHSSISKYWKEVWSLQNEHSVLVKDFPLKRQENTSFLSVSDFLEEGTQSFEEKLLRSNHWPYRNLPLGTQQRLAHEIAWICSTFPFIGEYEEYKRIRAIPTREQNLAGKSYVFQALMSLNESFIHLLLTFDFPQEVPKVILFNNERNGDMDLGDVSTLLLLNRMGLDIVLFTPSGRSDLEQFLEPKFYDVHRLEQISANLPYKEKSLLGRLFNS